MTRIFYFHGRAGDLPAALLRHETAELKKVNVQLSKQIANPLRTIKLLAAACDTGPRRRGEQRAALNALIRTPFV
jgi:hypothetical protein